MKLRFYQRFQVLFDYPLGYPVSNSRDTERPDSPICFRYFNQQYWWCVEKQFNRHQNRAALLAREESRRYLFTDWVVSGVEAA